VKPLRTQRALYLSRVPSVRRLCVQIHLPVTTLEPGPVDEESRVLLFHRVAPVRVHQGLADGRGYRRDLRVNGHRRKSPGLQGSSRVSCHHRINMTRVAVKERRVMHRGLDASSLGLRRWPRCPWRRGRRRRRRDHRRRRRWRHRPCPALVKVPSLVLAN
jgi:hypothetical protein